MRAVSTLVTCVALSLVSAFLVPRAARAETPAAPPAGPTVASLESHEDDADERALRARSKLRTYHRSMGYTTWISFAATMTIGTLRYANVVGFGTPLCDPGETAIFGRAYGCGDGLKIQHLISATFTTASYVTTRVLAASMPEPLSPRPERVKIHRALSWVHLGGMIAMPILGFATSGTSDPATRDGLATAHLAVGYTTFAALTAAASLMVF